MSKDYTIRSSLTSPADISLTTSNTKDLEILSKDEVMCALKELNNTSFVDRFKRRERFLVDPQIPHDQRFSLISFLPSKTAIPDKDGVYGILKVRGTYETVQQATDRATFLIENVDSYHDMYHVFTGEPFPLSRNNTKYIKDVIEVDIKKKVVEVNSDEIRLKRNEEGKDAKEIKEREKALLADVNENKVDDPVERYTELLVKKAQLTWTYVDNMKKLETVKQNIRKAREEINKMDLESNHTYREQSLLRFQEARKQANVPNDDQSFLKYLVEDLDDQIK